MNETFRYRLNLSPKHILCLLLYSYISDKDREHFTQWGMWWEVCWRFQSKLGHINKKMVWLICISLTTLKKFNWSVSSFNDGFTYATSVPHQCSGCIYRTHWYYWQWIQHFGITVCHALHGALHPHSFTTLTEDPLLTLLYHHCNLTHPPGIRGGGSHSPSVRQTPEPGLCKSTMQHHTWFPQWWIPESSLLQLYVPDHLYSAATPHAIGSRLCEQLRGFVHLESLYIAVKASSSRSVGFGPPNRKLTKSASKEAACGRTPTGLDQRWAVGGRSLSIIRRSHYLAPEECGLPSYGRCVTPRPLPHPHLHPFQKAQSMNWE